MAECQIERRAFMKASRRILSILLAVLMILPVMAVIGCNKRYLAIDDAAPVADNVDNTPEAVDDDPVETEAETEAATEAKVETEADDPDDLGIPCEISLRKDLRRGDQGKAWRQCRRGSC